jgi:PAS domain S-box-containing protein
VLDRQLRYQYFNAAEQFLGKPAAVLGKTPAEAFGDSYGTQLQERLEACRRVMQTGVPEVVTGAVSYNGRVKHLEVSIYPTREGGVFTVNRDLTGQYDAEQQYRDLAESIADIFYALDRELRFTYWNKACERLRGLPAAERMFGYAEAEIAGQGIEKLMPESSRAGHHQLVNRYADSGAPTRMLDAGRPVHALRRDGEMFPVEASISQINIKGKKYFTAILRDITERVRNTQKLEEEKQRLEMAILGAGLGFWDWNPRTNEAVCNEQWAAILGYALPKSPPPSRLGPG